MSETTPGSMSFSVPPTSDFNTLTYQGSMQQVLQDNVGKYVIVEFLIGTTGLTSREGILYYVGSQFLVLYDEFVFQYVVCDIFSVKFVTFLDRNAAPVYPSLDQAATQMPPTPRAPEETAAPTGVQSPSQAAYAHATRRNPTVRY